MPRGRTFTAQFKAQVVLEVLSGAKTSAEVCRQHQIHPNLFYKWRTTFLEGAPLIFSQEEQRSVEQERIAELERAGAAPAASGFLGSAPKIGPWGAPAAPRPSVPPTRSPLQAAVAPQQGGGGSFLRSAMATAAGVAGGALLFEGIRNLMGSNPGPFGQAASAAQPAPLLPQDSQQASADNNPMPDELRSEDYDTAAYDDGDTGGSSDDWA